MRRGLINAAWAAALLLAVCAPQAGAATTSGSLTVTAVTAAPDGTYTVTAAGTTSRQCAPTEYCGYFPIVTTVPAAQACSPAITGSTWVGSEHVYDDASGRLPQQFAPTWREWPTVASGPKRACLYARAAGAETLVAEAPYEVPGEGTTPPPATPPTTPPGDGSDVLRTPMPRAIGVRRAFPYRLSTASIPPTVDATRYALLVRVAARRWGLRGAGTTNRVARSGDRRDTVGFSRDVPRAALGVTRIRSIRFYRRLPGGRLRVIGERVIERDLSLSYGVPWHAGPGVPPRDRVDLQTVIIHEFGHYAGNDHVRNCRNSPMWTGLRPGEWWWSRDDWFQFGCRNAPRTPATATAAARTAAPPRPGARLPLLVERSVRRVVLE